MAIQISQNNVNNFTINDITSLNLSDQRLLEKEENQIYMGNTGENTYLTNVSATAPTSPMAGDMYYNITDNKIYTYLSIGTWDVGTLPQLETIYINLFNNKGYFYNGNTLVILGNNSSSGTVTSVNGQTGDVTLTTNNISATSTNRYVPATPISSADTQFLNGNGVFVPVSAGGASSVANIFLSNTASNVSGYKTLNYIADTTATEVSVNVTSAADVLSGTYLYLNPLDTNYIDAGIWQSTIYMKCSNITGINRLKIIGFVRHLDGTETDLFTKYTLSVNSTSYSTYYTQTNRNLFTVLATDRLGFRIYGNTDRNPSTTITYVIGGQNPSFINSPLTLRHSQLRDLNGLEDYQHITSVQQNIINSSNIKVSVYDNSVGITGNVTFSTTLSNPVKLKIYFTADNIYSSVEIYNPLNKQFSTNIEYAGSNSYHYMYTSSYLISSTGLTFQYAKNDYITNSLTWGTNGNSSYIKIYKIIEYI